MGEDLRCRALIEAVEAAAEDGALWPRVFSLLREYGAPLGAHVEAPARRLTQAERSVLGYLVAGRTPGEIAVLEGVAISTVRTHVARLHEKFGASRTLDVVRMAIADGAPAGPAEAAGNETRRPG